MESVRGTAEAGTLAASHSSRWSGIAIAESSTNVRGSSAVRIEPPVTGTPCGADWPEHCGPRQGASLGAAGHRSQGCGTDRVRMVRFDEVWSDLFDGATAATV